ncbi:acetyl/propionyl/methylcrotonyl-CoA carboxylase subunit alpha [Streptomyces zingiberis]|uniref:biotin carboxylase n=1 Tax=Streptomyces zingiberis TaxID=2053010 RepID=A0ABX1BZI4_9ACTN|nr:biotin carboxylase N-terminal domain-containing protein [Streptomyces zingiberis]NJQ02528.1 ATP-grasp domain-containing protein [Streptomyces zingiberis]
MFESVLVANRGEIAVRVIRTLRRLGVRSVAVFSDADAGARHVREADTAVRIGPAAAAESYLSIERLLDAAARSGARAVHPGYGFLAENAAFVRACEAAGLVFIGPPAGAVELMGDKIRAKETVRNAGVPVVPGSSGSGLSDAELAAAAREIGMPVLLKPSAGGGGKGMRLVRAEEVLAEEIAAARREARGSFGDDTLLVERWIDRPRHIEIQLLADGHGGVVHLGERECSLQRRHQKIVEEAPSPLLDEATRAAMGEAAVQAARSCGYRGAGTVEFIVPGDDPSAYYFMEMNTRLQVEHPVTELVTGLDLVEWQIRVAAGEPLGLTQRDVRLDGHAVEARLCAETARAADGGRVDFLPSAGTVALLREPVGEGVRVDSGLATGTEVSTSYDPMLAKVIAHGPDRATALRRLRAALAATAVLGVDTNAGFLRRLLAHPEVVSGAMDTGLVDRDAATLVPTEVPAEVYAAAALLRHAALTGHGGAAPAVGGGAGGAALPGPGSAAGPGAVAGSGALTGGPVHPGPGWTDPFSVPSGWRLGGVPAWVPHHLRIPGRAPVTVRVRGPVTDAELLLAPAGEPAAGSDAPATGAAGREPGGPGGPANSADATAASDATASAAPAAAVVRARLVPTGDGTAGRGPGASAARGRLLLEYAGVTHTFHHAPDGSGGHWLGRDGDAWHAAAYDPVAAALRGGAGAGHAGALTAPMPGTVTVVKAAVGESVTTGQSLLVVEAMKMEHVIAAPHDGTVTELDVTPGSTVAMDQVLAVVTPRDPHGTTEETSDVRA